MARARSYRHDIACPHCGSNWMRKDGHSRGKQTYRCGDCQHRHTPSGNRHYYPESVKRQAVAMYSGGYEHVRGGEVHGCESERRVHLGQKKPCGRSM